MRHGLRRFPWLVGFLVLFTALIAFGSSPSAAAPIDPDIEAFIQAYTERLKARDAQGMAEMFTEPATLVDPLAGPQELSREELQEQFEMMFTVLTAVHEVQVTDVQQTISGDTARVRFNWLQVVENETIGRLQSKGKALWHLQRIDGQWYIAQSESEVVFD